MKVIFFTYFQSNSSGESVLAFLNASKWYSWDSLISLNLSSNLNLTSAHIPLGILPKILPSLQFLDLSANEIQRLDGMNKTKGLWPSLTKINISREFLKILNLVNAKKFEFRIFSVLNSNF